MTTADGKGPATPAAPGLVDASGRPLERSDLCPGCGAKPDQRVQASGFGRVRRVVCRRCGHDFGTEQA